MSPDEHPLQSRAFRPNGTVARFRRPLRALVLCALVVVGLTAPVVGFAGAQPAPAATDDPFEPNDTQANATSVSPGDEYAALSVTEGDVDYFAIEVDGGQEIRSHLVFDHDDADVDVALLGPSGEPVTGSASVTDNETVQHVAAEAGTYYVRVHPFSGAPANYSISFAVSEGPSPDRLEPNDQLATGTNATAGDRYSDLSLTGSDLDVFTVDLRRGEHLSVDLFFSHANADIDVVVLDPTGRPVAGSASTSDDEHVSYAATVNGTYYVRVYPYSGAANYSVAFNVSAGPAGDRFEPNDDRESATPISPGEEIGNVSVGGSDQDFYAVELDAGESITAEISFSHDEADIDVALVAPNGREVAQSVSVTDDEQIRYTAQESGTYYVRVYPYSGAATYSIAVERSEGPIGDGLEPNDRPEAATAVSDGDAFGNLSVTRGDQDFFAVQASEGETITASIGFSHSEADVDMALVGPDGRELADSISVTDDERIEHTVEENGTYYVRVYPFSGTTNYSFALNVTQGPLGDRLESNDDLVSSTLARPGDSFEDLSIHTESDVDVFRVDLEEGETLNASAYFSHDEGDLDLRLVSPDRETVARATSVSDDEHLVYTAEDSGPYYLVVHAWSGSTGYDLSVALAGAGSEEAGASGTATPQATSTPTDASGASATPNGSATSTASVAASAGAAETASPETEPSGTGSADDVTERNPADDAADGTTAAGPGLGVVGALVAFVLSVTFARRRS